MVHHYFSVECVTESFLKPCETGSRTDITSRVEDISPGPPFLLAHPGGCPLTVPGRWVST